MTRPVDDMPRTLGPVRKGYRCAIDDPDRLFSAGTQARKALDRQEASEAAASRREAAREARAQVAAAEAAQARERAKVRAQVAAARAEAKRQALAEEASRKALEAERKAQADAAKAAARKARAEAKAAKLAAAKPLYLIHESQPFGPQVQSIREAHGWDRNDLARECRVGWLDARSLSQIEGETFRPSGWLQRTLAQALSAQVVR